MRRPLLLILMVYLLGNSNLGAQDLDPQLYRTIDGTQNNPQNLRWGAAGENLRILTALDYSDGMAAPTGAERPNPRRLSNAIFSQDGIISEPLGLSDFCWVFGQFLDHDIGLTPDSHTEPAMISVPAGDPWFDPMGAGRAVIPMMRNESDHNTGDSPTNPRRHPNEITAYIDGSNVYGSDEERAHWLRSFEGGKLKVSAGNMLPFNTIDGEFESEVDPNAPAMDNAVGLTEKLFVAGDVRANENPLLLSLHTIFVREHNRLCDELAAVHPDWSDEQLYLNARKINIGLMQSVVYDEWLPALGVRLAEYNGFNSDINPQVSNIFTAAAFRMGHTLLNGNLRRIMADGTEHPEGAMPLREAFFNPFVVMEEDNGMDVFLKGMAEQIQQTFDAKVVDDVRNFLFGPPGAGGLDLAAININRGRERGLPDFNSIREMVGLEPYLIFQQINTTNIQTSYSLLQAYQNINEVDPWVGMLAERRVPGTIFGETVLTILTEQFTALRDGDRFFYLNDPVLTDEQKAEIKNTTFHDIIMRTTDIKLMQNDVFAAMPHAEICGNMVVEVAGKVLNVNEDPVPGAIVTVGTIETPVASATDNEGNFELAGLLGCNVRSLNISSPFDDHSNGVSTFDLVLLQKHLLGISPFDSPYKIIAADVDMNGSVSILDIVKMRKVVLQLDERFVEGSSWRFIPSQYQFTDPTDPFTDDFTVELTFDVLGHNLYQDYVAIKLGDVNGSARLNPATQEAIATEIRSNNELMLSVADQTFEAGALVDVAFAAKEAYDLLGYQFALRFDSDALELVKVNAAKLPVEQQANFAVFAEEGRINSSWNTSADAVSLNEGARLFSLQFRAKTAGSVSDYLQLDKRSMRAESYNAQLEQRGLNISYEQFNSSELTTFQLYQNQPNPFRSSTQVPFYLAESDKVELTVFDAAGKTVYQQSADFSLGYHNWTLNRKDLPAGVLYYRLATSTETATKKMLLIE